MSSRFGDLLQATPLPLDILHETFSKDEAVDKINLSIKSCRAEDGSAWTINKTKDIELNMAKDPKMNHEYIHPLGIKRFRDVADRFLLGVDSKAIQEGRVVGVQTLGGTSGLRLALEFLYQQMGFKRFYISSPASDDQKFVFSNHRRPIEIVKYPYWNSATKSLDFQGMKRALEEAHEDSVIVLQMCAHSPSGCDPSKEQWVQIADIMQNRSLFPLFDAAFYGLSSGDLERDAWPVRYFAERGFEFLCSQSFSSNLGLYNCRIGNLTFVANDTNISKILSESTWNFYNIFGTPAQHGANIVMAYMEDPQFRSKWISSLKCLTTRLDCIRQKLSQALILNSKGVDRWSYISKQNGLFSCLGLTDDQVDYLREHHHIYMEKDGIINVSAIGMDKIEHLANCIHQALFKYPSDSINNNCLITANAYQE